ncbi:mobilization protein [Ruegeria arenilitoris]|uniref:mobilization protein n=1 Tax=Ruegeria arenilitoris TaxID=1173585 RepID=UPI00147A40DD|nr:mobilization protein [Ruegeria arenilitoris]
MADLDQQIEQARARLKDLQARASKQRRRDETRRKIIYGAAVLKLLEDSGGEKADRLLKLLQERITRDCDREFIGF